MAMCPSCGAPLPYEGATCGACVGRAVMSAPSSPPPPPPLEMPPDPCPPPLQAAGYCSYCGGVVLVGAPFCPTCGSRIGVAPAASAPPPDSHPPSPYPHPTPYVPTRPARPKALPWVLGGVAVFLLLCFAGATTVWQMRLGEQRYQRRMEDQQRRSQEMQGRPEEFLRERGQPQFPGSGAPIPPGPAGDAARQAQEQMRQMMEQQRRDLQRLPGPRPGPYGPPRATAPPGASPGSAPSGSRGPGRGAPGIEALWFGLGALLFFLVVAGAVVWAVLHAARRPR